MTVSIYSTGTQTSVIGTTHTLDVAGTSGTFQLAVDLTNMINGDVLELRIGVNIFGGQSNRTVWYKAHRNAQGSDNAITLSPPTPAPITGSFTATLLQTTGTVHAYPWAIYKYP